MAGRRSGRDRPGGPALFPGRPTLDLLRIAARALHAGARAGWQATRSEAVRAWRTAHGDHRAVLIDLDSLGVKRAEIATVLAAVLAAAGPHRVAFAAGHPRASASAQRACRGLGIAVLPTRWTPDAADKVLIKRARSLHRDGVEEFVVCSHDGDFRRVPGRLLLAPTGPAPVSGRLLARADAVLHPDHPAAGPRTR